LDENFVRLILRTFVDLTLGAATRPMRTTLVLLSLCALLVVPSFSAETKKPPQNIVEHYKWCGAATEPTEARVRYEGFWSRYRPTDAGYEDAVHVRFVHLCAYRLAELYAETGKTKKCREMLKWLESEDYFIK
jgi:hypothetical protein